LGSLYATVTALLIATQEPFSFLAAKRLDTVGFILVTQVSLLVSIPLLLARPSSRRDFVALLRDRSNWWKLAVIFAIGMSGLTLYNFGLSNAHPIIIAAILNLSPFWAALVALLITRVPIPVAPKIFFGCLAGAFLGAMAVAWSQLPPQQMPTASGIAGELLHGGWVYAIPVPACSALGGTLIGMWFSKYEESAAIAANFLVPAAVLIPGSLIFLAGRSELTFDQAPAILLMMLGTIVAASIGRVLYQVALTVTGNDNGFVTMFFLLVPVLTALISLPMSWWISELHFNVDPSFFVGLALIGSSLLLFSLRSWRAEPAPPA
jgi:drug/metabolite transporter (DMT)-like permease